MTHTTSITDLTSFAIKQRNLAGNDVYRDIISLHEGVSVLCQEAWSLSCEGEIPEDIADIERQVKYLHGILSDVHQMLEDAKRTEGEADHE